MMSTENQSATHPKFTIVALGEILWDIFPDRTCFGGAPANYACAAAELGSKMAEVHLVSGVGSDKLGRDAIEELKSHHVVVNSIQEKQNATGTVTIELNENGSASYAFTSDVAWDNLAWSDELTQLAQKANAVCFGSLGQRSAVSAKVVQRFVSETTTQCLRIFDINLRPPYYSDQVILDSLSIANVLKLNDEELPYLATLLKISGTEPELLLQIIKRFNLKLIALTKGNKGATIAFDDETIVINGIQTSVIDTVGAGDSFTAALTLGLLQNAFMESDRPKTSESEIDESVNESAIWHREKTAVKQIGDHANQVAAFVCSQPGATPNYPEKLKSKLALIQ